LKDLGPAVPAKRGPGTTGWAGGGDRGGPLPWREGDSHPPVGQDLTTTVQSHHCPPQNLLPTGWGDEGGGCSWCPPPPNTTPSLAPRLGLPPLGLQAAVELGVGGLGVIFFIQEVQGVVAGQAPDGEFVGHLGPLLPVAGHPLVELRRLGEEVLQQPGWGARWGAPHQHQLPPPWMGATLLPSTPLLGDPSNIWRSSHPASHHPTTAWQGMGGVSHHGMARYGWGVPPQHGKVWVGGCHGRWTPPPHHRCRTCRWAWRCAP